MDAPSQQSLDAVNYHIESIWDGVAALHDAYLIDQPEAAAAAGEQSWPRWRDLSQGAQILFMLASRSSVVHLLSTVRTVAEAEQGRQS